MSLDDEYKKLGEVLAEAAPSGWQKAWVDAQVHEDASKTTYDYIDADGKENWFQPKVMQMDAITDCLSEIRAGMLESGNPPWIKCRFTIESDGSFSFDIDYLYAPPEGEAWT